MANGDNSGGGSGGATAIVAIVAIIVIAAVAYFVLARGGTGETKAIDADVKIEVPGAK